MRGCGSWCSLWTMEMNPRKIVLLRQCFVKLGKGWVKIVWHKKQPALWGTGCRLLLAAVGLWLTFEEIVGQSAGIVVARAVGRAEFAFAEAFKAHHAVLYGFFRQGKGLFAGKDV